MNFTRKVLPNGLRLITSSLAETKAVTVLVLLPVGSRYESKDTNGVSHFIEHLMFKGTKKRPKALDISRELDAVGAEFNAFTSKDYTGYYIKLASEKVEIAFDILSDMLFGSLFDAAEIDKERGVIVEEINMYEDNPLMHVEDLFERAVYENHPLGYSIAGPREVIKTIPRQKILAFRDTFYSPSNMIVGVAGNITPVAAQKLTKKYFGVKSKKIKKVSAQKVTAVQKSARVITMSKKTEQVQLCLGFPGPGLADKKILALSLLATILGGNMSSRLFVKVREEQGLAYGIRASVSPYLETSTLVIQAGLDQKRLSQALEIIIAQLERVKNEGVTAEELTMAKEYIKGKMILNLEDSEQVTDWFTKQELFYKKIKTPTERMKELEGITLQAVKTVAQAVIKKERLNTALIGPISQASLSKMIEASYKNQAK